MASWPIEYEYRFTEYEYDQSGELWVKTGAERAAPGLGSLAIEKWRQCLRRTAPGCGGG